MTTIGWREWVSIPGWGIVAVKAKVDSGARTSALHAENIRFFKKRRQTWVRFDVHPLQGGSEGSCEVETRLIERRKVRSSTGHLTERPVVRVEIQIGRFKTECEVTLVNRDLMGFRMLIGRQAIRRKLFIDTGRSYLLSHKKGNQHGKASPDEDRDSFA